jgi:putative PIN family toxin of toxin-antitoxin system
MILAPGTERLKAVLETNIYIAAFAHPKGRNAAVWNAAVDGRYELVVSPAIIRETAKVLRGDFAWQEDRVQKAIREVAQVAHIIVPHSVLSVVTADPDDNRILECAMDGKADIIVSNDHHLLDLRMYAAIPNRGRSGLPPNAWPEVVPLQCMRADPSRWKAII